MSVLKAFVLMPFDDPELDSVYSELIEPALVENSFKVTRADLSINQQQILKDIVIDLAEADLVIVDVSGLNGNVMYELGLAHAMGKRTVMITQDITELPFDLNSYRATPYSTSFVDAQKLRESLSKIARGVVDGSANFSNPVQDFAPEFLGRPGQLSATPKPAPVGSSSTEVSVAEDETEPGLLDYSLQLAASGDELVEIAEAIGAATEDIGEKVTSRSSQIPTSGTGVKHMTLLRSMLRSMAKDFDAYNQVLSVQNPLFEKALTQISDSANGIARSRVAKSENERDQMRRDIDAMNSAEQSFSEAYDGVVSFSSGLSELPSMEESLTRAVKRTRRSVDTTAEMINLSRAEFARARALMEERLSDSE